MENNRLVKRLRNLARYYLVGFTALFFLYALFVLYSYAHIDNIKNYCIHVSADQPHDFIVSKNNACLIDWLYFVREPLLLLAFIYGILAGPVWMVFYFLQKKLRRGGG